MGFSVGYNNNYSYNNFSGSVYGNMQNSISSDAKSGGECQTCKNRKYQDGSNEMVSFKSAAHISPNAAGSMVRSHEQEHVSNAYKKAAMNDGTVVNASVAIHTSVCPECGRTYVSGGTTTTAIKYNSDPYAQNAKAMDAATLLGSNLSIEG